MAASTNRHDTRESWLRTATKIMRPYFEECGYPLPENIRFAIAFTSSGKKGALPGETWHGTATADGSFEIIIKGDEDDALEILGTLMHQLAHAALPADAGHGKPFKAAAASLGLHGPMRFARPTPPLRKRLEELITQLGPLPHARLNLDSDPMDKNPRKPVDKRAKQKTYLLSAKCPEPDCGYTVRVTSKWAKLGAPGCPIHGAMKVSEPKKKDGDAEESAPITDGAGEGTKVLEESVSSV